jgi:ankyrin repeat protein
MSKNVEPSVIEAIKSGDTAGLRQLIEASDDLTRFLAAKVSDPSPTNHAFGYATTPLQFASFRPWKDVDSASILIEYGATIDIHSACGTGRVEDIERLLEESSQAYEAQVDHYFPVQYAIAASVAESIDVLMNHGDDPNRDLKKMAYFGWEDEVIDASYTPWKPIHMASLWGFDAARVPVAECLAKHGADLNAVSPLDGYRPIHLVAMPNRVDMIRFFVDNGVDVDSRTGQCETIDAGEGNEGSTSGGALTPLMVACGEGFLEATQCLLELGADVRAENDEGKTALDFAEKRFWGGQPYDAIIEVLKGSGA